MTPDTRRSDDDAFTTAFARSVEQENVARLRRERDEAYTAYNDALTALDAAMQQLQELPPPRSAVDDHQLEKLNHNWDLHAVESHPSGWRARLKRLVWESVGSLFDRQHTFNSTVVDHLNRNAAAQRDATAAAADALAVIRDELAKTAAFHSHLLQFLQQITPFVDTRERVNLRDFSATLDALADEVRKRWDSTTAWERRLESSVEDIRSTTAAAQQVSQTLKRELERLGRNAPSPARAASGPMLSGQALDSYKYVGFEDAFRGSTDDIRERLASYLPYFEGAADVLDVGCGRGEFLELLRDHGVQARGIDLNREMVEQCRTRDLTVDEGDVLSFLSQQPDASLGGLFASQVVEHLAPDYLLQALDAAFHKLKPRSTIILETINVASWSAFFQSYVRDVTHRQPLHPETLRYLVTASGFQNVRLVFASPCASEHKLEASPMPSPQHVEALPVPLKSLLTTFNENVEKLNALMFADQDYAVIGERL